MQLDVRQPGIPQRLSPPVADRVLVWGIVAGTDEQPPVRADTDVLDVCGEPYVGGDVLSVPDIVEPVRARKK
jgi:hypothetical protein